MRIVIILALIFGLFIASQAKAQGDPKRGKYIMHMGGCVTCHKTPKVRFVNLGGGQEIKTEFGIFRVPNITPHPEHGIGKWSEQDFLNAMTKGIAPDGSHYYPAFPYTSYTKMTREDLLDLKAYLDTVEPHPNQVGDHELLFPYNQRYMMGLWKKAFFKEGTFKPNPDKGDHWNRGAYIVRAVAHCGQCHTPRNKFGALIDKKRYLGNPHGANGEKIPSMKVNWREEQIYRTLRMGMKPDGLFVGGSMGNVIGKTTSKLTKEDLRNVVDYILDR